MKYVSRSIFALLVLTLSVACGSPESPVDPKAISSAEGGADGNVDAGLYKGVRMSVPSRDSDFKIFSGTYEAYKAEGFRPRSDVRGVLLEVPIDWKMDPFRDNNWRFQLQAWRMLPPLWGQWQKTGDKEVLDEIIGIIRDWYSFHIVQKRWSSYLWQDMATGIRASHLGYMNVLVRRHDLVLDAADTKMLAELTDIHVRKLRDPEFISINNHGIFQVQGLRLLCNSAPQSLGCAGEEAFSASKLGALLQSQFDEYGVHTEDSPFYHQFAVRTFRGIRLTLYPSLPKSIQQRLRTAQRLTPWFAGVDGEIVAVGDSEGKGTPFPGSYSAPCGERAVHGECFVAKDLTDSGYAIVRTSPDTPTQLGEMLFVVGSSHDHGHDHADELSFVLYREGRPLLVDSGKYAYIRDEFREFFLSDRAHNTIGLVGRTYLPEDTAGEGSYLRDMRTEGGAYVIRGEVVRGDAFLHRRELSYRPGESISITDEITAAPDAQPELRFNLAPDLAAELKGSVVEVRDGAAVKARIVVDDEQCTPSLIHGVREPEIRGWNSPSYLKVVPAFQAVFTCSAGVRRVDSRVILH